MNRKAARGTIPINPQKPAEPEAARPRGPRTTDLMGRPLDIPEPAIRDTIKDPPMAPMESLLDADAAAARTKQFVEASAKNPALAQAIGELDGEDDHRRTLRHPRPVSDRREAAEGLFPVDVAHPAPVGAKIDISKADPRRAPTQKIRRRPAEPLERDWSLSNQMQPAPPPPVGMQQHMRRPVRQDDRFWLVALAILVVLALVAVYVVRRVVAQPPPAPAAAGDGQARSFAKSETAPPRIAAASAETSAPGGTAQNLAPPSKSPSSAQAEDLREPIPTATNELIFR